MLLNSHFLSLLSLSAQTVALGFPPSCPPVHRSLPNQTLGICPNDFTIIGNDLQAVHKSQHPPTGLALDNDNNIYIAYPRNTGPIEHNLVIVTGFDSEEPWPSSEIQSCADGQDLSTCFVNVQNPVLDSSGIMWVVDNGIPPYSSAPLEGGAKIMSFNIATREMIRTYPVPADLLYDGLNLDDLRVNATLGWAFMTDSSVRSSIVSMSITTGQTLRHLYNTSMVKADEAYVGSYDGRAIYTWHGTNKSFTSTGADGITLASGNVYWSILASRRFYYISQSALIDSCLTPEEVEAQVMYPGNCATEQAGLTADDKERVYITASEQNAIYYVDTDQSQVNYTVNGVAPGGTGPVKVENYVVKSLVRNGLIQHADSMAIMNGWLYFVNNQLLLSPTFQYGNVDHRKGPFRTYRYWIGRGPAV